MTEKIPISLNEPLYPGDKIEIRFSLSGGTWRRATQWAIIENRLQKKYAQFRVTGWTLLDDGVIAKITIITPEEAEPEIQKAGVAAAITATAIAVAVVGGGLIFWARVEDVKKIVKEPAVQAVSFGFLIVAVVLLIGSLRKK